MNTKIESRVAHFTVTVCHCYLAILSTNYQLLA